MKEKRLLLCFAHPDDESFGPGGTIAKYAALGAKVYLLCATHGEAGQNKKTKKIRPVFQEREKELKKAAEILGIKAFSFLNFLDGEICNHELGYLTAQILKFIQKIKPQVVLTFDLSGHYGHLDHIGVTLATTYAFWQSKIPQKLYYQVLPQNLVEKFFNKEGDRLFFGFFKEKITTKIKIKNFWPIKRRAIKAHQTQRKDWEVFLPIFEKLPKEEYFYLAAHRLKNPILPEIDLFAGIC